MAKKNYVEVAKEWLAPLHSSGGSPLEEELAALLEEAYEDGHRDGTAASNVTSPALELRRDEEALLRKTNQILGKGERSLDALRKTPHMRRAVAQYAKVEVEHMRDFLEDRPVGVATRVLIEKSLRELKFLPPKDAS